LAPLLTQLAHLAVGALGLRELLAQRDELGVRLDVELRRAQRRPALAMRGMQLRVGTRLDLHVGRAQNERRRRGLIVGPSAATGGVDD